MQQLVPLGRAHLQCMVGSSIGWHTSSSCGREPAPQATCSSTHLAVCVCLCVGSLSVRTAAAGRVGARGGCERMQCGQPPTPRSPHIPRLGSRPCPFPPGDQGRSVHKAREAFPSPTSSAPAHAGGQGAGTQLAAGLHLCAAHGDRDGPAAPCTRGRAHAAARAEPRERPPEPRAPLNIRGEPGACV